MTYMNQSMAQRRATSSRGRLTACRTISMVTRPADGIAAAPTAAATAVNLWVKKWSTYYRTQKSIKIYICWVIFYMWSTRRRPRRNAAMCSCFVVAIVNLKYALVRCSVGTSKGPRDFFFPPA